MHGETYRVLVFNQALIVTGQRHHKKEALNAFKAVYPLLSFRPLTTHIHHAEIEVTHLEERLGDAGCSQASMKHVLVVWHPACLEHSIDILIIASACQPQSPFAMQKNAALTR
jgi:hypothetical protein